MKSLSLSKLNRPSFVASLAIFAAFLLLTPVSNIGQNKPWTSAGSTGTVDEEDLAIFEVLNFTYGLKPGATGTVDVRFNITATEDIGKFCPATAASIKVRFRDSDGAATGQQVFFSIRSTNLASGGNVTVATFNSNTAGFPADAAFHTATLTPAIDFDFVNNVYWVEAQVVRTNPSGFANLGGIQIAETAGTPCP